MLVIVIFKKERDSLKKKIFIAGIYAVMAVLVLVSNNLNNSIAMKRAGMIITACENYKNKHGNYPSKLEDLVPEFLNKIPTAKYALLSSNFRYSAGRYLMYVSLPPFGRPTYSFESKKWGYLD